MLPVAVEQPNSAIAKLWRNRGLIIELVRSEVLGRYRGSLFGIVWSLLTPLFMLAVYTFMFGSVIKARWPGMQDQASMSEFAIILFSGLIVYQLFSEVLTRAPTLILSNTNYVKKVVFPLEILPVTALGSALFHFTVSGAVLLTCILAFHGGLPITVLWLPLVVAPLVAMILGLAWFLASLGVYFRDINQFLSPVMTALLFLSPVFFPTSAMPESMRTWIALNPVTLPVEQARNVMIWGSAPDLEALAIYAIVSMVVCGLGYLWFQSTRKGFADVL